jgi:hypothetical protein
MIQGSAKFDAIVVGEFTASFIGPTTDFKAKAAFVNSKTGQTHGWTSNQTWSKETIIKLLELRALMETDLGALHLENGGQVLEVPTQPRNPPAPTGLSEHVGDGGLEQV